MSDSSPRKKDDNDNDGGEKNTCAANKRQNCSPEKGTPPQTDSSARRSDDPGERIQAHHVSQSIVQAQESRRKEGVIFVDATDGDMRKELLKAKTRHQSAGNDGGGGGGSSSKAVDEGFETENGEVGALRRRKPVSLTSSAATTETNNQQQRQQRFSLPIPDNFHRPMSASRLYKVIVIGEIHTGKSALIRRYIHNFYSQNYCATIGVDFRLKLIHYNDDLEIRLQLWDIAGQERFSSMTRAYYKGTMGAIVVFDHSNAKTYRAAVDRWKRDLDDKCSLPGNRSVPAILVANKVDLKRDPALPDDLEISRTVQERGFVPKWYKTSAKTGENVEEAMNLIVKYIMTLDNWSDGGGSPADLETSSDLDSTLMLSPPPRAPRHLMSRSTPKVRVCYC